MTRILTILFFLVSLTATAQSVRLPSGDSITYDFSGATRKGSPGLYKYFTTNTADDGRIIMNVADFNRDSLGGKGWRGMINFQAEYNLDSIKFYDRSGSRDTIWIYTFDKDNAPKWDTLCNPEDYTPDYIIVSCGSCSGLPVTTKITATPGDKVQFAFVVMRRTNLFSGLWPDVSQISFYGSLTGLKDTTYNLAHWAMQQWVPRKIGDIVGHFNLPNQQDTTWADTALVDYGYMRTFDQMFYDNQNVAHGLQSMDLGGGGYTGYKYNAAMARRGHYQIAAIFNNNAYFNAQQSAAGHGTTKGWGTNTFTDDPQLPSSYSRKGYYMHGQAWIGGACAGCPGVRTYNGTAVPGQEFLRVLGTTNEPTLFAFANAWKTPIEVAAEAIGVYDSVKLGDPNMIVMAGAFEAYNYDDAKAMIMLMKLHARSRNIKLDGVDFHAIHTLKTDSFQYIPNSNQQVGNYGVSPGYWDDWRKNIHYQNGLMRESGNINLKVSLTEDTYQKGYYKQYPVNVGETFSVSQLAAPGYDVAGVKQSRVRSHGVGATQLEFIASASGLYQHVWYQVVDDIVRTDPAMDAIDGNNGKFDRPTDFTDRPESWPADYLTASRKRRLKDYKFVDSVHTEFRGLHVFKYVHVSIPDSVMYEFAVLDSTGTDTYIISGLTATTGRLITPSFTSRQATQSTVTITGGTYTLNADPLPRAFIVYEPGGGPAPNLPPDANAGANVTITLPTSSATLNGNSSSDPDGTISSYLWSKTSGPATYAISTPNNVSTSVINLVAGTYVFTLTVTDNDGGVATDTVTVTVNAAPAPVSSTYDKFIRMKRKIKPPR
jgi:hypothetical protein